MGADNMADPPRRSTLVKRSALRRSISAASASKASPGNRRITFGAPADDEVIDVPQVDDEREMQQDKAEIESDRRKSLPGIAELSNAQVAAHYSDCVKLNAENKINAKNAFSLQLIDCMAQMIKRDKSELDNFQVAGYTLDASAKIYGCRVEVLHGETMRMAGGLGRGDSKQKQSADAADTETEPTAAGRKRKGRRRANVERNEASLNGKLSGQRSCVGVETVMRRGAGSGGDGPVSSALSCVLIYVPCDSNQLLVGTGVEAELPATVLAEDTETDIAPPDAGELLFPALSAFSFRTWNPEDEENEDDERSSPNPPPAPPADLRHRFDVNTKHSIIMEESMEDHFDGGGLDDGDGGAASPAPSGTGVADAHVTVGRAGCKPAGDDIANVISMLSAVPQEYSYFDLRKLLTWAGPKHWKLPRLATGRPAQKPGQERARKQKAVHHLDYDTDVDFSEAMRKGKRSLTLKPATVKKWDCEKTTLPENLHCDIATFHKLYKWPDLSVSRGKTDNSPTSQVDLDSSVADYDYDNEPDTQDYCPRMPQGENCEDYDQDATFLPSGGGTGGVWDKSEIMSMTTVQSMGDLTGDNLVQAPKRVEKIHIAYARTAKQMDMRKLKNSIWGILTDINRDEKENSVAETPAGKAVRPERMSVSRHYSFRELYHRLPARLSAKMADNLSVALAFTAVLHLANERSLKIAGAKRLDDFLIAQDVPATQGAS